MVHQPYPVLIQYSLINKYNIYKTLKNEKNVPPSICRYHLSPKPI